MSWARSFYLRKRSSLYKHKRIVSSHFCSEWSLWSFSSKMSKMSIMLIMLTVIISDSSDQSDHFKTLITQWLSNHCCYVITCKRVLTKMNTKVDALIRMFLANVSESAQHFENHFQTILIFDRVDVLSIESKANLYQRVWMINQTNEFCSKYKQAMNENKLKFHITKLKNCKIIDDILFRKDLLWVSENMHTKLLQEVHD